jgi:surface antigen
VEKGTLIQTPQKRFSSSASRRKLVRYGLIALNVVVLGAIAGIVMLNPRSGQAIQSRALLDNNTTSPANPLDQLASANIALTVARMSGLSETVAINNQADSQAAQLSMVAPSDNVVSKPQVVTTTYKTNKDIIDYVTVEGDNVSTLASKFGVTSASIRLSNNLSGDGLRIGTHLVIPPVNGMVYTVASGDTADSLARKYSSDTDRIIAFNDAEIHGLKVGERIVIPGATQPAPVVRASVSYGFGWGGSASYGSNGYDPGYCTWYVANKRIAAGNPLPNNLGNASTWGYLAAAYGLPTGRTPQVGAAVITSTSGYGHVGYVERVNPDGSFTMSEMNANWVLYQVTTRTFSAAEAGNFTYIY